MGCFPNWNASVLRRLAVFVGHFTLDAALAVVTSATLDQARRFRRHRQPRCQVDGRDPSHRGHDALPAPGHDARLRPRNRALTTPSSPTWPCATQLTIGDGWSRPGPNGRPCRPGQNGRPTLPVSTMFARRWNGALAPTAMPRSASDLPPPRPRSSWRCLCLLNVIAGRSGPFSPLMMPLAGQSEEMHLQAGLGISSMHMHGESDAARVALNRSLAIAEERGDVLHQAGLLGMLHMFHFRGGDFKTALDYAKRCRALAGTIDDPAAIALAHSILGMSLLIYGRPWRRPHRARGFAADLVALPADQHDLSGLDRHYRAGIALARTLWLQGYPAQAVERAAPDHQGRRSMDHPASLSSSWLGLRRYSFGPAISGAPKSTLIGPSPMPNPIPWDRSSRSDRPAKRSWPSAGAMQKSGVESLRASLEKIHAMRYELMTTEFDISLVQGLAAIGRLAEGMTLIDETMRRVEANGDASYMPELLRVKARLLLSRSQPNVR